MQTSSISEMPTSGVAQPVEKNTKTLIEEFGDKIQVDSITYLECIIAFKRGVTFKWIRDVDKTSYKVFLKDQDFEQ